MTTPPTITVGAADAASTIAGSVLTGPVNTTTGVIGGPFRYTGSNIAWMGAGWPNENFVASRGSLTDVNGIEPYAVEFTTNADVFELWIKGSGGRSRFSVNGQRATFDPMVEVGPGSGSLYHVKVQFASAATRVIRWDSPFGLFGGVRVAPPYTVTPPTGITDGRRIIVIGDSFTEGTGALSSIDGYASLAGYGVGIDDVWASGSGATGYLNNGSLAGKTTFRGRAQNDVLRWNPDLIVVAGGINDGAFTAAQITTEAGLLFAMLKAGAPDARIVVLSPFWPNGTTVASILPISAAINSAAVAAGLQFIDMVTDPWITGSGKVGTPNGTGNADLYISSDGTHPSPAGHVYIGGRIAAAMGTGVAMVGSQLCTLAQVKARINPAGVSDTVDDVLITELIDQVSSWIEHFTGRKLAPDNGKTYVFSTEGGYVLRVPMGIRTVTSLGYNSLSHQPDTGGSYTAVAAAAILLRPSSGELPIGWPPTEVRLSRATTLVFGTIENGATVTGNFGFAATPPDIQAVTIDAVVAAYQNRKMGASGVTGMDGDAIVPWVSFFSSGSPQRATLERYRYIGMG